MLAADRRKIMKITVLAATAFLATATSASAGVMTVAGSHAGSCYDAAEARTPTPQALAVCDEALTTQALSEDDRLATLVNRGILLMISERQSLAMADFHAAMAMNPRHPEPYLNKSVLIFDGNGSNQEAAQLADKALQLGTKRPGVALYVLALAKEDAGDVESAYRDLVRSAALEPKWDLPRQQLQRYRAKQR
jgi:tetratricopeptide (TPR) repeat protein